MVQNYYNLAASDTDIVGLMAYLWPGGLDEPNQLGVRNMPQSVIDMNVKIGTMIKANYSPCTSTRVSELLNTPNLVHIFPNPTNGIIHFEFNYPAEINQLKVYNFSGEQVISLEIINSKSALLDFTKFSNGIYFYTINGVLGILETRKFVKY